MRPPAVKSGCTVKYKKSGSATPKTTSKAGPKTVHGIGFRKPRKGIGCAGAARFPRHKNKSRRVIPLPINVSPISTMPDRVRIRAMSNRPPQLAFCDRE